MALADELAQGDELLKPPLEIISDQLMPKECLDVAKDDYCSFTTRVAGVAEAINLSSLQALMSFVDTNVTMYADAPVERRSDPSILNLLQHWPAVLSEFVRNTDNSEAEKLLRDFLHDQSWPWRVDNAQFESMLADIRNFVGSTEKTSLHSDEEELLEPTVADISLRIPDDVSPKLLVTFQQELPQSTAELSQRIQQLFTEATLEDVTEARRVAHTLKGAANIVGVPGIANVTHYLEDILESLANNNSLPSKALSDDLTDAVDCLEMMSEAALGMGDVPPQALDVLKMLLEWRQKFFASQVEDLRPVSVETVADPVEEQPQTKQIATPTQAEPQPNEEAAPRVEPIPALPAQQNILDQVLDISGELSSSNLLTQGQLQALVKHFEELTQQYTRMRSNMGMLQEKIYSQELRKTFVPGEFSGNGVERNFDPLELDQYNELHSLTNVMAELMDDVADTSKFMTAELSEVRELLNQQDQLNKELDQTIMAERLVSVQSILPRLQRSVRQTCRMTGKQAELVVVGETLDIDNSILEAVVDPLLHMLRNAVDHGVEAPERRIAVGKSEEASILLSFKRIGNNIVIHCRDDGAGIDITAVKNKALELGLIKPEEIVNENTLYELILQPGFSVKTSADQISGRGVGMDVVAKRISDLRGSLLISSEEGQWTEFVMTVPQTLLKSHVVLLRTGEFVFGVLSNSFSQIVSINSDHFYNDETDEQYVAFNDQVYEVRNMTGLLGVQDKATSRKQERKIAILVNDGEFLNAALIDEAIGSGELVIKKLGEFMPRISGIIGTVLTEKGAAAPVFDLKELLRKPSQIITQYLQQQVDQIASSAANILIVDDSSSARRSISQVARDAGYDVRTAIDGIEAISLIEEQCPDLLLTDLEMPKMNGLELAAHLRSSEKTRDLPIVMVTSRSTEKHRSQALSTGVNKYITKPFTNDDLVYEMHELLND